MSNSEQRLLALLEPLLEGGRTDARELYVVAVQVAGERGGRLKVTVLLDSDEGVTIDECASIGRQLGGQMDEGNFFGDAPFTLEVSSPGADQPLVLTRQYKRHVGRRLNVTLRSGEVLIGKLLDAGDATFTLEVDPPKKTPKKKTPTSENATEPRSGPQELAYDDVAQARVEFSLK